MGTKHPEANLLVFITWLSSCRKANIRLGGLSGAAWIRKWRGCERAAFRVLSSLRRTPPRRQDKLLKWPKDCFQCSVRWDAAELRHCWWNPPDKQAVSELNSHLIRLHSLTLQTQAHIQGRLASPAPSHVLKTWSQFENCFLSWKRNSKGGGERQSRLD